MPEPIEVTAWQCAICGREVPDYEEAARCCDADYLAAAAKTSPPPAPPKVPARRLAVRAGHSARAKAEREASRIRCAECGEPFTTDEYADAHHPGTSVVHERCCVECQRTELDDP